MPNTVEIIVGDVSVRQFTDFKFKRSIDTVGAPFSFRAPFFPDEAEYRALYEPFKYKRVVIKINNKVQYTGRMERVAPFLGDKTEVLASGRALPGVLVDATFQQSDFPVQYDSAALDEIAAATVQNFDFNSVFESPAGAIFEEAGPASPTQTIFTFLHNYAKQRKLLMSQTPEGDLLFRRAVVTGAPVGEFTEGDVGVMVSGGAYDGTARFSSFDMFGQEPGANDNYARVVDPALVGTRRPKSILSNDTNSANILEAAEWAASATVGNSINIPLRLSGWTRADGTLWSENSLIILAAPSIMVYKPFSFLVKAVTFELDAAKEYTALDLTIPGAYSGQLPEAYPWGQ